MERKNLARSAGDYFAIVLLAIEGGEGQVLDAAALRNHLRGQLDSFMRSDVAKSLDPDELAAAHFALVAWADEMLVKSSWSGREEWAAELLQAQLFGTNRGGDEFYEHLERLRPNQNEARRIFFLCFVFGFEGQLIGQEPERRTVMQQQYEILRAGGAAQDLARLRELAPEAYAVDVHLEPPSSGSFMRILMQWGGGALMLYLALLGILYLLAGSVPLPGGA